MLPDYAEAVPVSSVSDEYAYISAHPCPVCGAPWKVRMQALLKDAQGHHYDRVHVTCCQCARHKAFLFDINSLFADCQADG
jgi:formate dehydrogenase maturation protein FdhE